MYISLVVASEKPTSFCVVIVMVVCVKSRFLFHRLQYHNLHLIEKWWYLTCICWKNCDTVQLKVIFVPACIPQTQCELLLQAQYIADTKYENKTCEIKKGRQMFIAKIRHMSMVSGFKFLVFFTRTVAEKWALRLLLFFRTILLQCKITFCIYKLSR